MNRWEYRWATSAAEEELNELGAEGWEAVAYVPGTGPLMKRELPADPREELV